MVLAVSVGSAPEEVGASVEPKRETMREMPAALYCCLMEVRSEAVSWVHSSALSKAPSVRRKERALWIQMEDETKNQRIKEVG